MEIEITKRFPRVRRGNPDTQWNILHFVEQLEKSSRVIAPMFARISRRYDFLNHLLSFNSDRRWRRTAARALNGTHRRVLDLATGTGDLAVELSIRGRSVVGADFCLDMLALARPKLAPRGAIRLAAADALALPFPNASFDGVTVAFGVRNFAALDQGLSEMKRILRPGGTLLVLEFSHPSGPLRAIYRAYARRFLPWIGGAISGDREAYRYLNRSAEGWPGREEFSVILRSAGFRDVTSRPMTFGVVALHTGTRP